VEGALCRGLLQHMLASWALVYPSQGGRYCAEACMALGSNRVINGPLGVSGRTPLYIGLLSAWDSVDGDRMFLPYSVGELLNWGI